MKRIHEHKTLEEMDRVRVGVGGQMAGPRLGADHDDVIPFLEHAVGRDCSLWIDCTDSNHACTHAER